MLDQVKNLQDNALLYELSLAVGSSLDTHENCGYFLEALTRLKNLTFASVWLKNSADDFELFYTTANKSAEIRSIPSGHFILQKLVNQPFFSIAKDAANFPFFIHEKNVEQGAYALFKLSGLGFLKLYAASRASGFSELEMVQLKGVVHKFAISIEGCEAHRLLMEETDQRILMQKALKQVNHRLRESESKLRQVIDYSLDAVVIIDTEGHVTEWSMQAESMFGILREEALGVFVTKLIVPPRHQKTFEKAVEYFLRTEDDSVLNKRIEITALRKNGKEFPIELSISVLKNEEGHFFSGFIRDITERRRGEDELQNAQIRLTSLITNLQAAILLENENREIVLANRYFCEVFNIPVEPAWLVGKDCSESAEESMHLFAEPSTFVQRVELLLEKRELVVGETLQMVDGRVLERDFIPLFADEKYLGHLWQYRDVTEQRKAEQKAEQARLAERQFLANMSHEIRTPMNAVIGMSHLLYETDLTPKQKDYLGSLRFSADSLLGIINDILDLSKIEAGELGFEEKEFHLNELLHALQRTFQFKVREKPISVTLSLDPKIKHLVIGDPTRLIQILTNLLGNASKFTKQGTIGLDVQLINSESEFYEIKFKINDTGVGIPKDKLEDIFKNFKQADVKVTRKFGGTGLGLTIVKQLVEMQGGKIWVESKEGKGSAFTFLLALKKSEALASEQPMVEPEAPTANQELLKNLEVLIVEDNAMNQKLITQILEIWGCHYQVAHDGLEGLLVSRVKTFDLILMDVHMPEMDGMEATQKIRIDKSNPNIETPIIALTAAALLEEKKRALESGMNDFLTKPFSPRKLKDCILKLLGGTELIPQKIEKENQENIPASGVKIDLKYLFEFSNGDRHFVIDMVETYLRETPETLNVLDAGLTTSDWDEVYKVVHKLKPNFMMLGMENQRKKSIELETLIKSGKASVNQMTEMARGLIASAKTSFILLEEKLKAV